MEVQISEYQVWGDEGYCTIVSDGEAEEIHFDLQTGSHETTFSLLKRDVDPGLLETLRSSNPPVVLINPQFDRVKYPSVFYSVESVRPA